MQSRHVYCTLYSTVYKLSRVKSTFCDKTGFASVPYYNTCAQVFLCDCQFVQVFALHFEFSLRLHTFNVTNKSYFPLKKRHLLFWISLVSLSHTHTYWQQQWKWKIELHPNNRHAKCVRKEKGK